MLVEGRILVTGGQNRQSIRRLLAVVKAIALN